MYAYLYEMSCLPLSGVCLALASVAGGDWPVCQMVLSSGLARWRLAGLTDDAELNSFKEPRLKLVNAAVDVAWIVRLGYAGCARGFTARSRSRQIYLRIEGLVNEQGCPHVYFDVPA